MSYWRKLRRGNRFFVAPALVVLLGFVLLSLLTSTVFAFTLLGDREIRMGSSQPGDVNDYTVEFDVATTGNLGGIVVTFCANTPTIGDPECEKPPNFDLTTALANLNAGDIDLTGYQAVTSDHSSSGTGGENTVTVHSGTGYNLGDTGLAGGLIFHIDGNTYYEAAPAGWDGGSDPQMQWGCYGQEVGVLGTAIGDGASNTRAIVDFHDDPSNFNGQDYYTFGGNRDDIGCTSINDGTVAAKYVDEATINGYSDWFMPSQDELNAMYQNLQLQNLGGFASTYYSSSTESPFAPALGAQFQTFSDGQVFGMSKHATYRLRPARAFTESTQLATAGSTAIFDLVNVTNQDIQGTFYARIYTYADPAHALGYTLDNPWAGGDVIDAGGVALSTAEAINITFRVPERLTFCLFTDVLSVPADYQTCSGFSSNTITLGNEFGFLSSTEPSINKAATFNIATNAAFGATVRARGSTLTAGSFSIDPVGLTPGDGTQQPSQPGSEQFGFCVYEDIDSFEAGITPAPPYNHADCANTINGQAANIDSGAQFAFDAASLNGAYGDSIATKQAGEWSTGRIVFLGNITNFTEPGAYTTSFDIVATGRY